MSNDVSLDASASVICIINGPLLLIHACEV